MEEKRILIPTNFKINYEKFMALEEDELAQVEEIFKHFDFGNNGRVKTVDLPKILRLLQHNIGKIEESELKYEVDKKNKGYFTMRELVTLLSNRSFETQSQQELLQSLQELDDDADGYITKEEMRMILTTIGESLDREEMQKLIELACDSESDKSELIDIKRLAEVLLPDIQLETELEKLN